MQERRQLNGLRRVRTIGTFALGAAAGSLIMLLCAPASGRVIRRRIALEFQNARRSAGRKLTRTRRLLTRKVEGVRDVATEKFNGAREWLADRVGNGYGKHPYRRRAVRHA